MLDNYDSFTYNLVQYLQALGADVKVVRNDELTVAEIEALEPSGIVISPGPCTPNEAGVSVDVIRQLGDRIPILGVCLGHQSIGQAYGGDVVRAGRIMHGKTSHIRHEGKGVFAGLPDRYEATRYHSLVVDRQHPARRPRNHRLDRERRRLGRGDHGPAPPRASRWKACSSTPSRSSPSTATRC